MTSSWPSKEECDEHVKKFPMGNEFPTAYLPPENKGFEWVICTSLLPGKPELCFVRILDRVFESGMCVCVFLLHMVCLRLRGHLIIIIKNLLYILTQTLLHLCLCIVSCLLLCNRIHPLLGTAQGLALTQQHPFPWYPPVCTGLSDIPESQRSADQLKAVKTRHKLSQKIPDAKMQQVLIRSVNSSFKMLSNWADTSPVCHYKTDRHWITVDEV